MIKCSRANSQVLSSFLKRNATVKIKLNFNKKEKEARPTNSNLQHGFKRSCNVDMDYQETSKKKILLG